MDFIELGPAPADELCAQMTDPDFDQKNREECRRYLDLIRKACGPEPEGARLTVKSFQHDFGTYREVVCHFDSRSETAVDYAFRCESEAPAKWDEKEGDT